MIQKGHLVNKTTKKQLLETIRSNFLASATDFHHISLFAQILAVLIDGYDICDEKNVEQKINKIESSFPYNSVDFDTGQEIVSFFSSCRDEGDFETAYEFAQEFCEQQKGSKVDQDVIYEGSQEQSSRRKGFDAGPVLRKCRANNENAELKFNM